MGSTRFETRLAAVAKAASLRARALIRARYEESEPPYRLYFHVWSHTQGVIERGQKIAEALGLSPHEKLLTHIGCAFHDVEQNWVPRIEDGRTTRVRETVKNEYASAVEAARFMAVAEFDFSAKDVIAVMDSIIVTIPSWSVPHKTAIQPGLTPDTHPVARAVALADLAACAMSPKQFAGDGYALFAEDQIDVMTALARAHVAADIPQRSRQDYRDRLIVWLGAQVDFVRGRRGMLGNEIRGLPAETQGKVMGLFRGFDQSETLAAHTWLEAQSLPFVSLMRRLLPTAFPGEPA